MIVVNHDKGFAEMLQHPAFRNRRTRRHPVDVDSSLLAPRRPHADSRHKAVQEWIAVVGAKTAYIEREPMEIMRHGARCGEYRAPGLC